MLSLLWDPAAVTPITPSNSDLGLESVQSLPFSATSRIHNSLTRPNGRRLVDEANIKRWIRTSLYQQLLTCNASRHLMWWNSGVRDTFSARMVSSRTTVNYYITTRQGYWTGNPFLANPPFTRSSTAMAIAGTLLIVDTTVVVSLTAWTKQHYRAQQRWLAGNTLAPLQKFSRSFQTSVGVSPQYCQWLYQHGYQHLSEFIALHGSKLNSSIAKENPPLNRLPSEPRSLGDRKCHRKRLWRSRSVHEPFSYWPFLRNYLAACLSTLDLQG